MEETVGDFQRLALCLERYLEESSNEGQYLYTVSVQMFAMGHISDPPYMDGDKVETIRGKAKARSKRNVQLDNECSGNHPRYFCDVTCTREIAVRNI